MEINLSENGNQEDNNYSRVLFTEDFVLHESWENPHISRSVCVLIQETDFAFTNLKAPLKEGDCT